MLSRQVFRRRSAGPRSVGRALAGVAAAGGLVVLGWLPALPAAAATAAAPGSQSASGGAAEVAAAALDEVRDQQLPVLNALDVEPAWSVTYGQGVTVAVIDSGVNGDVSDLEGSVTSGPDYTGLKTSPTNPDWGQHGTWMASIIAGHGDDGFSGSYGTIGPDWIVGVAPEAKILSIRVIPDTTDPGYHAYDSEPEQQIQDELAHGIRTAVQDGAQVISMSIGYSAPSGAVRAALQYAYSRGVVLVASSGNSGQTDEKSDHGWSPVSFPADYPGVLSVAAVDGNDNPASFSSSNLSVQVAAPGDNVPAQGNNGQYYTVDGTSPACALVAGVAALIKSAYPKIPPALVLEAITTTAKQTGGGGYNVHTGFGIVDADAALTEAGVLLKQHPAGSQVSLAGHFGGGAAAVPGAPVPPRGSGQLVLFSLLAAISLAAAAGGLLVARRTRGPRHRPEHG
jgi:type VII secretion-associated serine protease mycosin